MLSRHLRFACRPLGLVKGAVSTIPNAKLLHEQRRYNHLVSAPGNLKTSLPNQGGRHVALSKSYAYIHTTTAQERATKATELYSRHFDPSVFKAVKFHVPPRESDPTLDLTIFALHYTHSSPSQPRKEPLLLVHGHPENLLTYRHLGPRLAKSAGRDIVIVDLRGYGLSGAPPTRSTLGGLKTDATDEQLTNRYSKREMARDLAELMQHLGYEQFSVLSHDRGSRVTHRLALDHPDAVQRVMILDIVPAPDLYQHTDAWFAKSYFHWFLFLQPYPMPEEFISRAAKAYIERAVAPFPKEENPNDKFPLSILENYVAQCADPAYCHATLEDYRASGPGGVDNILDLEEREKSIRFKQPLRVHWGDTGVNELLFKHDGCFDLWRKACSGPISGGSMASGHFMTEDVPEAIEASALEFFD